MTRDADLCALALRAARAAAKVAHAGWRTRPRAEHKGPIDLVTQFDRASEDVLRAVLGESGLPVVAEEAAGGGATGAIEGAGDAGVWLADPLDGTTNFVHGHPFYCVSIGLVRRGAPVLGVVVAPALGGEGWEWTGTAAGGSARNGAPCRVSETTALDQALLATGFPYDRATTADDNLTRFGALKKVARGVRRCGSAAIDLCFVADGTYDGYWEKKLQPWDLAAGAAIVLGAGGRLSGLGGEPARVVAGELVATNGRVHDALVARLANAGD
jgi:myo-inositol-1(or 4)-monophosphatase